MRRNHTPLVDGAARDEAHPGGPTIVRARLEIRYKLTGRFSNLLAAAPIHLAACGKLNKLARAHTRRHAGLELVPDRRPRRIFGRRTTQIYKNGSFSVKKYATPSLLGVPEVPWGRDDRRTYSS